MNRPLPPDGRAVNPARHDPVPREPRDADALAVRERDGRFPVRVVPSGGRDEAEALVAVERDRGALQPRAADDHARHCRRHHRHAGRLAPLRGVERANERADVASERDGGFHSPRREDEPSEPALVHGLERAPRVALVEPGPRDERGDHRGDARLAREVPGCVHQGDERGEGIVEVRELGDGISRRGSRVAVGL